MLRTRAVDVSLWEAVLPPEVLRLPEELARVDALLDDPVFFAPFVPFFDPRVGRPSTPMEVYMRMMFLKFRYRLGYESLCREVSDSITWRRFCRIPIDGKVPHPTTLMKLTTRCGTAAVEGCNEALLAKAAGGKLLRTYRLRADTTVVPADVAYPTDSGLLAKAIRRIAVNGRRIQAAGGATRTSVRDRSRAAGKRAHGIAAKLRMRSAQGKDEAHAVVKRITGELAGLAERAATDAERLLSNARRGLRRAQAKAEALATAGACDAAAGRRRGRLRRAVNDLTALLEATRQVAAQTRQRVAGITPSGTTRRVSLHERDARPIAKGRLDTTIKASTAALTAALDTAGSTLTELHGLGPVLAAKIVAHSGDVTRFPSRHHYASYCGTAPIEASSGDLRRHRLSRAGNRQLNAAVHVVAVCQARDPGPGRDHYRRKLAEAKTPAEARRSLKRNIARELYNDLQLTPSCTAQTGWSTG